MPNMAIKVFEVQSPCPMQVHRLSFPFSSLYRLAALDANKSCYWPFKIQQSLNLSTITVPCIAHPPLKLSEMLRVESQAQFWWLRHSLSSIRQPGHGLSLPSSQLLLLQSLRLPVWYSTPSVHQPPIFHRWTVLVI